MADLSFNFSRLRDRDLELFAGPVEKWAARDDEAAELFRYLAEVVGIEREQRLIGSGKAVAHLDLAVEDLPTAGLYIAIERAQGRRDLCARYSVGADLAELWNAIACVAAAERDARSPRAQSRWQDRLECEARGEDPDKLAWWGDAE